VSSDEASTAAGRAELADRTCIGLRLRDRYRIVTLLGRGALGEVAVAEDEVTGERVAVRLLPRELSAEAVQRSRRSIVAASAAHPAFIRVLDSGETSDGRSFVVMELAEGRGLNEELADNEPLEIRDALRLALDLGGAIETLHNLGIVHAAVRPCNVRILAQGRLKLMDLEVAGLRGAPELREALAETAPAEYLAPEQVRGSTLSDRTDVYAFGLTLYELLCGAPPFRNGSREAVLSAQLDEAPPRIRRRRHGVAKGVQTLVTRALAKQPESRPFMSNLLNDLDDAASRPATSWKRVAVVVGGVLVLASMAIPFIWDAIMPQPDASHPSATPPAAVTPAVPVGPQPPTTTEAPPAHTPSAPVATSPAGPSPTPPTVAVPPPAAPAAPAETAPASPAPTAVVPPPAPTVTLPPPSAAPTTDASLPVPAGPRRPPMTLPPASTPPATVRETAPSPPPASVRPTPPSSSAPAAPPALPERRALAPARTEARPTPERSTSAPERPANAVERRATTPERPSSATERDDADGGAAIDWLLKRPGTSNQ
jgi:serine/threonine protein kinase